MFFGRGNVMVHSRAGRILVTVLLVTLILAMLPTAALAGRRNLDATALEILRENSAFESKLASLPEGRKGVKNVIPKRCVSVKQGDTATVSIRLLRPTLSALSDLRIQCDSEDIDLIDCGFSVRKTSVTLRLKFRAYGDTGVKRIRFSSVRNPSLKRYAYVTVKKGKVKIK